MKGVTFVKTVFVIGFLILGAIILINFEKLNAYQVKQIENDVAISIAEEVKGAIEKAQAYPSDADYKVYMDFAEPYEINISQNTINVRLTRRDVEIRTNFFSNELNIIPSFFSDSGVIYVYKKDNNLLVTDKLDCDINNNACDPDCSLDKCDPFCYTNDENGVCNNFCIDINDDDLIDQNDKDNICDPDCNTNFKDDLYDWDCAISNDNICDPDQDNITDNYCDLDCLGPNGVCDPDCTEYDYDCPAETNNLCEPARGEDCENNFACVCENCCPGCINTDEAGCCVEGTVICNNECIVPPNLPEGQLCSCDAECAVGLKCSPSVDQATDNCCPPGTSWDGSSCVSTEVFDFVFVPIDIPPSKASNYRSKADSSFALFMQESPFRECADPNSVAKKYVIDPSVCAGMTCSNHCSDCIQRGRECLAKADLNGNTCDPGEVCLDAVYDIFAVITTRGSSGGCAGSIPNDGSSCYLSDYTPKLIIHETGHTLGLFHVEECGAMGGCRGPNVKDCSEPNRNGFHMTYCHINNQYGPHGYYFLKHGKDMNGATYFGGFPSLAPYVGNCQ